VLLWSRGKAFVLNPFLSGDSADSIRFHIDQVDIKEDDEPEVEIPTPAVEVIPE
jgi:hypothetical protein